MPPPFLDFLEWDSTPFVSVPCVRGEKYVPAHRGCKMGFDALCRAFRRGERSASPTRGGAPQGAEGWTHGGEGECAVSPLRVRICSPTSPARGGNVPQGAEGWTHGGEGERTVSPLRVRIRSPTSPARGGNAPQGAEGWTHGGEGECAASPLRVRIRSPTSPARGGNVPPGETGKSNPDPSRRGHCQSPSRAIKNSL